MNIVENRKGFMQPSSLPAPQVQGMGKGFLLTLVYKSEEGEGGQEALRIKEGMKAFDSLMDMTVMKEYLDRKRAEGFAVKGFSEFRTLSELMEAIKSQRKGFGMDTKFLLNFGNGGSLELNSAIDILEKFCGKGFKILKGLKGSSSLLLLEFEPQGLSKKEKENGFSLDLFDLEPDAGREHPLNLDLDLPRMDEGFQK